MQEDSSSNSPDIANKTQLSPYAQSQDEQPTQTTQTETTISWTASEYIAHEKSKGWFVALALISVAIGAILYLITRDITVVCLAIVGGFVFGFYGAREPKLIDYEINDTNLVVGQKRYDFREFKSFSVVSEGAFSSIVLWPHKRFAQLLTMYYPPEQEDQIVQTLGGHLPQEIHKPDLIETLMKNIRF